MKTLNSPTCVDDFGNYVYRCHWTDIMVSAEDAVITGGFYPGLHSKFVAVKDHYKAKKDAHYLFNEMDANCNTCKNLTRTPHKKEKTGFLYGECKIHKTSLMFHPDDHMGMKCYEGRRE